VFALIALLGLVLWAAHFAVRKKRIR